MNQTDVHVHQITGSQEESAMHATPESSIAATLAIDLAKDVFELGFADAHGRVIQRQRLRHEAFASRLDNHAPLRIVMEACGSAHHWARRFTRLGHRVELLPAHDVRPYVRRNKTDRNDVDGLLEAARCPGIRPVPVKTPLLGCIFPDSGRHHSPQPTDSVAVDLHGGVTGFLEQLDTLLLTISLEMCTIEQTQI
jgi:hypothetical protein